MASDNAMLGIGIIVIILIIASVALLSSQISALKAQAPSSASNAGLAANVSTIWQTVSATATKVAALQAGANGAGAVRQTGVADVNMQGFILPANSSRELYDIAGLGGGANLEFNARIQTTGVAPGDVQLQFINASQLAAGNPVWLTVPTETNNGPTEGTFPVQALGDLHNDEYGVAAVRIVNLNQTSAATFSSGDMISITISCMTSHNPC